MSIRHNRTGIRAAQGFGLNGFTSEALDSMHWATLSIFEKTGIRVESQRAAEILAGAGAMVSPDNGHFRVKFKPYQVEDALRKAPSSVTYYGRTPEKDFIAEPNRVGFAQFGECINVIDPRTRKLRPSVKTDCRDTAVLADALEEIVIMERSVCPGDMPSASQPVHNLAAMMGGTSKHIVLGTDGRRNLETMMELGALAAGGKDKFARRPLFTATVCPTSPMTLVDTCCDAVMAAADNGIGILIISMCLSGGTSPASLAGTIVQHNVEVLSALILAQAVRPGTPCTYGSCTAIMDMKTAVSAVGAPEYGILNAGIAHMARYYRIPSLVGGGLSDSKVPDAQAGYEFGINALTSALAGANIVYGSGGLEMCLTFDYAKLLMDHECMKNIRRTLAGVTVDDENLAVEVIEAVGPGNTYLTHPHTFERARSQSRGDLFDRNPRDRWAADGEKTAAERAYEAALNILDTHEPAPLPKGAEDDIDRLVAEYDARIAKG